jgi:hypothetical protein
MFLLPARAKKSAPDSVTLFAPLTKQVSVSFGRSHAIMVSVAAGERELHMRHSWLFMISATAVLGQNTRTGPAVGQPVPDFSLQDQKGRTQTLKSVSGPRGTMLVFFRSADW